jgi:DNA-binding NarL/FixJ family response regulator
MLAMQQDLDQNSLNHVLVIDDHPLFCEALAMTLGGQLGVDKVSTASSLSLALDQLANGLRPEIILLDLNLPDVDGLDGLMRIRAAAPDVPVIVVSSLSESAIISNVLRAGAAGFIPKDSPKEVLVRAFTVIWDGGSYAPEGYLGDATLADSDPTDDAIERLSTLTPQQASILRQICAGKLNKQIAYDLSIAETTVKAHITAILRKLGVHSRTQAVLVAQKAKFDVIVSLSPVSE